MTNGNRVETESSSIREKEKKSNPYILTNYYPDIGCEIARAIYQTNRKQPPNIFERKQPISNQANK